MLISKLHRLEKHFPFINIKHLHLSIDSGYLIIYSPFN